jgi:hypothetical protein
MKNFGKGKNSKNFFFCDKLNEGFAIEVKKEQIKDFFDTISFYEWIQIPKENTFVGGENIEFKNQKYYFVLIGRRIFHTHKPEFGGQKFDVEIFE